MIDFIEQMVEKSGSDVSIASCRFDRDGHAIEGQLLTEKGGSGGGSTNWKTLSDVKTEHLGHGEKVSQRLC